MYFFDLLVDLHESYSPEKAEETIAFIRQELSFELLYEHDGPTLHSLINDQHDAFYEGLARELVADLNSDAIRYFRDWQPLLSLLDRRSMQLLYAAGIQRGGTTEAGYYLQGMQALDNEQPHDALFFFHGLRGGMRHYFIGRCYAALQEWENALRQYDEFLEAAIERCPTGNTDEDETELNYFLMAQWHAFKEFGHTATRLGRYDDAVLNYELNFSYLTVGNVYVLSQGRTGAAARLFHSMVGDYLLALEQTGGYETALQVVGQALDCYPADASYTRIKERCEAALGQPDFASQLLTQVLQPAAASPATAALTPEKALAQLIVAQLQQGGTVFRKRLRVYEERFLYGQHYYVPGAGSLVDLLLEDSKTGTLHAVVVAAKGAGAAALDQLEHCIDALAAQLEREVKGILCLLNADDQQGDWEGVPENIEVYTWQLAFRGR